MKQKTVILAFLIGMLPFFSCSDDDEPATDAKIPDKVRQEFKSRYPEARDVRWDMVKDYHVARFNAPAYRAEVSVYNTSAWFTQNGQFCQTDKEVEFGQLPLAVRDAFNNYKNKMYPGWETDDCEYLAREGMSPIYVIEIEKGELEREISISAGGDILKDVPDDDEDDDILPIMIPEEINAALKKIFPETYTTLSILELEIDDDEIEIDIMESDRHKEVELDSAYKLVSIEYEISFEEARNMISEEVFRKMAELAATAGIDLSDPEVQKEMEIEVKEISGTYRFEIEIELDDLELEVEIDGAGNIKVKD